MPSVLAVTTKEVMGRIAQIIARHHEAKARTARLDRGAA